MRELLLRKTEAEGRNLLSIVEPDDDIAAYSLIQNKNSMLTENFSVQSKSGDEVAAIKMEHVLFTPAKMPKLTISTKNGKHFILKKEIKQLCDAIEIEGEDLSVRGNLFSGNFELLCGDQCIAEYSYHDSVNSIHIDENYELLAVVFAFAAELVK